MLYLNKSIISKIGIDWREVIALLEKATKSLLNDDFSQPIKPYLRYGDPVNRIIAMPAYVGGEIHLSGIKWIASFPKNTEKGLERASSVTILNEADTGVPVCIINTSFISEIRTAGVTGMIVDQWLKARNDNVDYKVGIIGFGPIGKMHLNMINELLGEQLSHCNIFDLREIEIDEIPDDLRGKVSFCKTWEEAYNDADIFITCTVSKKSYVDKPPKVGSLQLNVSLRDYVPEFLNHVDKIVVDDWEEVCRENTDIENMHLSMGLQKSDTLSVIDIICNLGFKDLKKDDVVMFNPMGMAVFDITIGKYYYELAQRIDQGIRLADFHN